MLTSLTLTHTRNILKAINHHANIFYLTTHSKQPSQVERNLTDALGVARNVLLDPRLVPGGGAVEMEVSRQLQDRSLSLAGTEQWPYRGIGAALEVIPRTLAQNSGANVIKTLTKLR